MEKVKEKNEKTKVIIVFHVAASSYGAIAGLEDFYKEVKKEATKKEKWIFVVSLAELKSSNQIQVLKFPWIKKSWIHRVFFDVVYAPILVKKYKSNKIFSMQNLLIPFTKVPQILWIHQPLPFIEYQYSIRENFLFWIYQNIIGKLIILSIKKAYKIVVETNWIAKECLKRGSIKKSKIFVITPKNSQNINFSFNASKTTFKNFFYPASSAIYKNHGLILQACNKLKKENLNDFKVVFTLNGDENKYVKYLYRTSLKQKLNIDFIGSIPREEVFNYYQHSVLLFPSLYETYGIPLEEAKLAKCVIFASNCNFSREILKSYKNAYFFDPYDFEQLYLLMKKSIKGEIQYYNQGESIIKDDFVREHTMANLILNC